MHHRVAAVAWVFVAGLAMTSNARADAIGPAPVAASCPRGSSSAVLQRLSHGQHAYCAPDPCTEGSAPRADGATCEVVELQIAEHASGSSTFAEATGTCAAPPGSMLHPRQSAGLAALLGGGPTTQQVPAGCHRFHAWVVSGPTPTPTPTPTPAIEQAPPQAQTPAASNRTGLGGCSVAAGGGLGFGIVLVVIAALVGRR